MDELEKKKFGLRSDEVVEKQQKYGKNELVEKKKESFFIKVLHILKEPMFLLLLGAAFIYFILGEASDGAIMLVFVIGIISIDVMQEWKTDKTLGALKDLSAPRVMVLRDGSEQEIASEDLVLDDIMMIYEGVKIPADGYIIKCNDLCVDESSLTGEAIGVWKNVYDKNNQTEDYWKKDYCYAGTLVTQGSAVVLVDRIGKETEYGKISVHIAEVKEEQTPLQKQTGGLVKLCAYIAVILFLLVGVFTYLNIPDHIFYDRIIESILSGITLAMAMIPEEFPVILTVFLSMGTWRLAKKHSLVRKLPAVETLGTVSVLCVDKTGTITKNQMCVQDVWAWKQETYEVLETMALACESEPYDPMEIAMLDYCDGYGIKKKDLFQSPCIQEYAFTNELKMMGHVWQREDGVTIAAKGSAEKILSICEVSKKEKETIEKEIFELSKTGLRVIGIAKGMPSRIEDIPEHIMDCHLTFMGLVALLDPPRESVKQDIAICNKAGIRVVMITGDNGITASSIAEKVGIPNCHEIITGDEINQMSDEELKQKVQKISIFSRVIPEHKMRIVKAFKDNGEVVAMSGDGVNDAPALKSSDIGIAMGKHGSEVSREVADLILMDDNFTTIVETVKDGRRIYDNIRKAVGYVFTIHIPIAMASLVAPFIGISPAYLLLLPAHVVLLELIIDPTCSIVLERQPAESDIMLRKPRNPKESLVTSGLLWKSLIQGVVLFLASFFTYYEILATQQDATLARTMGLTIIILSNIFLVLVNCSDHESLWKSMIKLSKDKVMWISMLAIIGLIAITLYSPLHTFLKLTSLSIGQVLFVIFVSFISASWYEIVKWWKRKSN